MAMYLALYQNVFVYDNVWRILKDCPKWQQVPALRGTPKKRPSPDTASDSTQSDEDEHSDRKASIFQNVIQSMTCTISVEAAFRHPVSAPESFLIINGSLRQVIIPDALVSAGEISSCIGL